ncbi:MULTISPECIES: AAA family ATPase [Microbacterium]|uniref:AAA family ATPase n=1 Tax=Microbacterium TaxID=33882 RepID=UPI003450538F
MQPSPYTPGVVAKAVPGRAAQLAFYEERAQLIANLGQFVGSVRVDYAARGVGKTSLLREAERLFERYDISTVWVTAVEGESLAASILDELRKLLPKTKRLAELTNLVDSATVTIGGGPVQAGVTIKPEQRGASAAGKVFMNVVSDVTDAMRDAGEAGLVILVDEIQAADKQSLRTISVAWQELASAKSPPAAGLFTVGLPGSQDHITNAVTFSERFDFVELSGIDAGGAATALHRPAADIGVVWDQPAIAAGVAAAQGYPYKVQLVGEGAWVAAGRPDPGQRITIEHLDEGMSYVNEKMRSLFAARWRNSSKGQRELLSAIASLGGVDVKREDVAARMGKTTQAISVPRDRLLSKGIIDASRRGRLSFTVPGFTEYILEQLD